MFFPKQYISESKGAAFADLVDDLKNSYLQLSFRPTYQIGGWPDLINNELAKKN
jgi:hypothetical protein